jgi:hypothetical protein
MDASYFITMLAGAAYPVTPANLNRIGIGGMSRADDLGIAAAARPNRAHGCHKARLLRLSSFAIACGLKASSVRLKRTSC